MSDETDTDTAAEARRSFADMIDGLTEEQLGAETLCAGWTPREVAGHVASFIEMSMPTMMFSMLKAGFNVDRAWDANARKYSQGPISAVTATIRDRAGKPAAIKSFPRELTTADAVVHTQDVRIPLGLGGAPTEAMLREALDFCTANKKRKLLVDPDDIDGLRLEATDIDWSWGSGDVVSGPADAILLAINGRDMSDVLTGPGVSSLPT
ncbi:maleylpyruvate isomerase family mycothiol-dependent enzyme [Ilumatobacter sp.]|uniref:maleylpyruvate isomerase family mycothiol-dependent enzyme n=1 Tax=Ilumatobacter sp. TaxID=1967498 RepID=UPI003AF9550A